MLEEKIPQGKIQKVSGSKEEAVGLWKTMPWALAVCVQREESVSSHSRPESLDFKCTKGKPEPEQGEHLEHRNNSLQHVCLC